MRKVKKTTRISRENERLRERYKNLPADSLAIVDGLIDQAAFMRIELEDMRDDILAGGRVELFSQSQKTDPYERERPVVRQHAQMVRNYQNIIKQLDEKLPKDDLIGKDDGFESFAGL